MSQHSQNVAHGLTQPIPDYSKLPPNPTVETVFLLDPLIATGGTAVAALNISTSVRGEGTDEQRGPADRLDEGDSTFKSGRDVVSLLDFAIRR